jgi:hypothetical protein
MTILVVVCTVVRSSVSHGRYGNLKRDGGQNRQLTLRTKLQREQSGGDAATEALKSTYRKLQH